MPYACMMIEIVFLNFYYFFVMFCEFHCEESQNCLVTKHTTMKATICFGRYNVYVGEGSAQSPDLNQLNTTWFMFINSFLQYFQTSKSLIRMKVYKAVNYRKNGDWITSVKLVDFSRVWTPTIVKNSWAKFSYALNKHLHKIVEWRSLTFYRN